jgi:5-methylcytosine-specific restriction endonuclease McrA
MSPAAMQRRRLADPRRRLSLRNQLVAMYGRSCWLCSLPIAYGDVLSIDHVRPLSKGGSNKIHNLRLSHERCNRKRGNGPVPELLLTADMALHTRQES